MRYAQIRSMDISNGPGTRISVFVQGCSHCCKGCFNPETWDFNEGKLWTSETTKKILELVENSPYSRGLSILGGDPISAYIHDAENEYNGLFDLLYEFKNRYSDKTVWLWTGYLFEEIVNMGSKEYNTDYNYHLQNKVRPLIEMCDVIVDGPYISLLNTREKYRGSENQRVIKVKETIKSGEIHLCQ